MCTFRPGPPGPLSRAETSRQSTSSSIVWLGWTGFFLVVGALPRTIAGWAGIWRERAEWRRARAGVFSLSFTSILLYVFATHCLETLGSRAEIREEMS